MEREFAPTTTAPAQSTTTNPVRQPETVTQDPRKIEKAAAVTATIADDELAAEVFTVIAEDEVTVEDVISLVSDDNFDTLDDATIGAIAAALSDQEDEVKEVFEAEVDIFSGATDDYVPSGSNVTVAERRIIIAATAVVLAMPVPMSAPQASSGGTGGSSDGSRSSKKRR